jgi:hypothetical protein
MKSRMQCEDAEILICDYATLASAERFELERHLADCAACAELARDSAAAIAFMETAAEVEPPPELITKILFDAPWTKAQSKSRTRTGLAGTLRGILSPILQPKFAMGMAMTILSLSMLARFVTPVRQLKPSDLKPTEVWAGLEDRAARTWARTVKFYENLKFVYQIQTTLREWQQQDEDRKPAEKKDPGGATEDRKLPVQSTPKQPEAGH